MHIHNGDPLSLFANLMPVHVHNLQTYGNLVSMHIIIYKEINNDINDISQIEERLISQILFWTQDV